MKVDDEDVGKGQPRPALQAVCLEGNISTVRLKADDTIMRVIRKGGPGKRRQETEKKRHTPHCAAASVGIARSLSLRNFDDIESSRASHSGLGVWPSIVLK